MKTIVTLAITIVLTAVLLVGCGCTNQNKDNTSAPTVLPTNEEVWDTTESTTRATTQSTMDTRPSETYDNGNGPLEDMMPGTNETTENNASTEGTTGSDSTQGRSRGAMGSTR